MVGAGLGEKCQELSGGHTTLKCLLDVRVKAKMNKPYELYEQA